MGKKTLVIGASLKDQRYSNLIIHLLLYYKHEVLAFGRQQGKIDQVTIETELPTDDDIHTITLYINADRQKSFYDDIIALNRKRVIFNPGAENPEFYKILSEANIHFEVACSIVLLTTNQY